MTPSIGTSGSSYDEAAVASGDLTDRPRDLREEDAFDVAAMHTWLRGQIDGLDESLPSVRQFPGGASNLTYLLEYPDLDLILRRPPTGTKAATAHDMRREFTVQSRLKPVFPYVPTVLALCTDPDVIGGDFYVMERVPGMILRGDLPAGFELPPERARHLAESMVDVLVALHSVDPETAGLGDLGRGAGYVRRQVEGWSRRFRAARTDNVPDCEEVMTWLSENQPEDVAIRVIHGDFRLDNLVLDPQDELAIRAVLDWEMATLGDPLMDLGSALAYWVQADDDEGMQMARRQPSNVPGMLTRREIVERYCTATGLSAQNWSFYEVFGLFRLAVIAQQIYYRYHHGQTSNPAFKDFHAFVSYADWRCRRIAGLA